MNIQVNSGESKKIKNRNLKVLLFSNLLHGFGAGIFNVVFQPFLFELTGSIVFTGILISLSGIIQFFPMPWLGKLSDRFGRKNMLLLGVPLTILGLLSLILSTSSTLMFLMIGVILSFLGMAVYSLNSQFIVAENSETSKGLMYGLLSFLFFVGSMLGNYLVIIGVVEDTRFYFQIFNGILIVEWIIYALLISNHLHEKNRKKIKEHQSLRSKHSIWSKISEIPNIKSIIFFLTFDFFVFNLTLSVYNGGLSFFYHLTQEEIALVSIWFSISVIVFQIPAGRLIDKIGKKKAIILSEFFGMGLFSMNIVAFFLWSLGYESLLLPSLIISQIFLGMAFSTFVPAESIILTHLDEDRKAESYGVVAFIKGIGFIPTGIIGGFLMEQVHYIAPFIFSLIGVIFEIWYLRKYFMD